MPLLLPALAALPALQVASQALRAILPAWTGAGKSVQELAAAVVAALPRVSRHRRLSLLAALVTALPQVQSLPAARLGCIAPHCCHAWRCVFAAWACPHSKFSSLRAWLPRLACLTCPPEHAIPP